MTNQLKNVFSKIAIAPLCGAFVLAAGPANSAEKILASDFARNDFFGSSISIDLDTLAVGAPFEDTGGSNRGSVYVLEQAASDEWVEVASLQASDASNSDFFGRAVSVDGDWLLVGAPYKEAGGFNNSGAAYVFQRLNDAWQQHSILEAGDGWAQPT